jgi:hypothetical protein
VASETEYQEVQADRRHYDVLRWTVVGLTYPTGIAAIAFAGSRWGFSSGRAFLASVLGSLWLIAGSIVFGQIHYYGQVRMRRAQELEEQLGFKNVSNRRFRRVLGPEAQPWYVRDIAWWFSCFVPVVAVVLTLLWGLSVSLELIPASIGRRDALAGRLGLLFFVLVLGLFVSRAAWRFSRRRPAHDE